MTAEQRLTIAIDSMTAVIEKLDHADEKMRTFHLWQEVEYVKQLRTEILDILRTAVKIGREDEGTKESNV